MLRMIESVRNIAKFLYSHAYVLSLTRKQNGNNKLVYSLLVDILDSNCMHLMSPFLVYLLLIISSLPHFIYSHATYIIFLLNPHLFAIEPHLKLNLTTICNVKKLPQAISKYCTTHIRIYLLQCRVSTAHLQIMPSLSLVSLCGCPQESRPLHCYNALELYILCKAVLFLNNLIPLNIFLNACPYTQFGLPPQAKRKRLAKVINQVHGFKVVYAYIYYYPVSKRNQIIMIHPMYKG